MSTLPRLRPLEIITLDGDEETAYLLRDPEGYAAQELTLNQAGLFVAAHFDGVQTLEDLRTNFSERFGVEPNPEQVAALEERLAASFLLEGEAFDAHKRALDAAFLAEPHRLPAHAGVPYPEQQAEAAAVVAEFWEHAAGLEEPGERPAGSLRAIIAPHIDLRLGGACTALAYRLLEEAPAVDTVIVLGTSHACPSPDWIVLDKPFETPLGPVPVNSKLAAQLAEASQAPPESVHYHRREHSVEFQALFLAALRATGRDLRMVPVLCGSLRKILVDSDGNQFEDQSGPPSPEETPFLATLSRVLEELGDRALVVAGADLAHVGPRFGDPEPLNERHLELLETRDRATLSLAAGGDAMGFYAHVVDQGDPRRICGLSPVYGLLATMRRARGKVLRYEQATDPSGTVSYATLGFWG